MSNSINQIHEGKFRIDQAWIGYLHDFAPWTHAVTLTLKRRTPYGIPCTKRILEEAAKHFIKALNYAIFKSKTRLGYRLASAVTVGWGAYDDHPHIHLSLAKPDFLPPEEFIMTLNRCADKMFWVDQQRKIEPYVNYGWSKYLLEHGSDNFLDELLVPSHLTE